MMKAKIEVNYYEIYRAGETLCRARIRVCLPTGRQREIPHAVRSDMVFMGEKLHRSWGYCDCGYRYRVHAITGVTWQAVEHEVDRYVVGLRLPAPAIGTRPQSYETEIEL